MGQNLRQFAVLAFATRLSAEPATGCTSDKIFARAVADECVPSAFHSATLDWTAFTGEVYEARSLIFLPGSSESIDFARARLQKLLGLVGQSFGLASQCPSALAAVSYSLAEVLPASHANTDISKIQWMQLALLQLALAVYPQAAHRECTQWPLRGRDLVAGFSHLATQLFPTNLGHEPDPSKASKVALVSACAGLHAEMVRFTAERNFRAYAMRHSYDLHFFADAREILNRFSSLNLTSANAPTFWRAYAMQLVLEMPLAYDWIMWIDCEVVITDLDRNVDDILSRHGVTAAGQILITADGWGIQPTMMLLRGGESKRSKSWSQSFLANWTKVPSLEFLHGASRSPPELRNPERLALQHATLPHWQSWFQEVPFLDFGESFQWNSAVYLSMGALVGVDTDENWLSHYHKWERSHFAWIDLRCHGRKALTSECQDHREQFLTNLGS